MKIYRHKQNEPRWLTARGAPAMSLPSGFVESDYFENTLIHAKCREQYDVAPAEIRAAAGQDLNGKTVLVMRRGGYGDLLWITRIVRKLKEKYPDALFDVASYERHHMVFTGNLDIRNRYPYPIPLSAFEHADYHLSFENCIEPDRTGRSVYRMFAERSGITLAPEECIPIYATPPGLSARIRKWMRQMNIGPGGKVMIHMGASTPWKSWFPMHVFSVASTLGRSGITVFLAGNKNVFPYRIPSMPNVYQVCYRQDRSGQLVDYFTMEESVALMSKCDLFIGQDSGLIHFSAALNVPAIGIYGAFPGSAYVSTYPNVRAIENRASCSDSPCYPHLDNRCSRMDRDGYAPCLKAVYPERVVEEVERILNIKITAALPEVECRRVA